MIPRYFCYTLTITCLRENSKFYRNNLIDLQSNCDIIYSVRLDSSVIFVCSSEAYGTIETEHNEHGKEVKNYVV